MALLAVGAVFGFVVLALLATAWPALDDPKSAEPAEPAPNDPPASQSPSALPRPERAHLRQWGDEAGGIPPGAGW